MECFDELLSKDCGVDFIRRLNQKRSHEFGDWTSLLLSSVSKLISFDSGCKLVSDLLLSANRDSSSLCIPNAVISKIGTQVSHRYEYQKLLYAVVRQYSHDPEIMKPLLDFRWCDDPHTSRLFLAMVIDLIRFDMLSNVVRPFVRYTHTYVHDKFFLDGLTRILSKVSKPDFDIMFGNITNSVELLISDEHKCAIVEVLCTHGDQNQRQCVFSALENYATNSPQLPPHFDTFLCNMLFIADRRNRRLFISRVQGRMRYNSRALRLHKRLLARFHGIDCG